MLLRETKLLFNPILEFLRDGVHRPSWEIEDELARQFKLTDDELKQRNPKGALVWPNNVAHALKELTKAKITDKEPKLRRAPRGGDRNVYFLREERPTNIEAVPTDTSASAPSREERKDESSWPKKEDVSQDVVEAAEHVLSEIARMAATAIYTAAYANGQTVVALVKNKDIAFTRDQLEGEIADLLTEQGHRCKLTGYDFARKTSNIHLKMSPSKGFEQGIHTRELTGRYSGSEFL
jgi:restriction endonuclease Mrr